MRFFIREFEDKNGRSPFAKWAEKLDDVTFGRIQTELRKLEHGNFSNVKALGSGVFELPVHTGPGYRIYFAQVGNAVVLLLGGGTKRRQQSDIDAAKRSWKAYRNRG